MAAYDFPDTAGKPTDGSFEYTAPDGTLYEWNGYAWVVPTDESGGGSGGAARVLTQVLPPSPAEDGDMYWCTDDGRLYLYYDDADTKQWVDASPDGGGNNVEKLIAGDNITLSPADGKGVVTINSTGGGGGPTTPGVRYQEGNWTPVFSSGSMNSPQAFWTRSGNTVFVTLDQNWATVPSGGDDFGIEGLPYASNIYASGSLYVENKDSELVAIPFTQKNENKIAVKGVSTKAAYTSTFNVSNGFFKDGYLNITLVYTTDDTTFVPSTGATVTEDIQGTGGSGGGTTVNNNGASAWGNFKKDGTINGSLNIASVTKTATGSYDVVFTTPMPSNAYSVVLSNRSESGGNEYGYLFTKALTNSGFTISGIDANQSPDDFAICFAVHSANAIAPQSGVGADAWGQVAAGGALKSGFNATSAWGGQAGVVDVTFVTPMPNDTYSVTATSILGNSSVCTISNVTNNSFRVTTRDDNGTQADAGFSFTVHASSTVTPTYTWTRDGTTLKPANDGDAVEIAGQLTTAFNQPSGFVSSIVNTSTTGGDGLYLNVKDTSSAIVVQRQSDSQNSVLISGDGSASFASGNITLSTNGKIFGSVVTSDQNLYLRKAYNYLSGDGVFINFSNRGAQCGFIEYASSSSVAYRTSSDYRLKDNIQPFTNAVDRVKQLNPCSWDWKAGGQSEGFIAHELQEVIPDAAGGYKDQIDDEGKPVMQGVDYAKLTPLLTAALQTALTRIETLEETNASLEVRLTALEGGTN